MKTAEKNATGVQGATAKANEATSKFTNRPSLTQKEAKEDAKVTDQTPAQTPKMEAVKTDEVATSHAPAMDNKPAHVDEPQKTIINFPTKQHWKKSVQKRIYRFGINCAAFLSQTKHAEKHRAAHVRLGQRRAGLESRQTMLTGILGDLAIDITIYEPA